MANLISDTTRRIFLGLDEVADHRHYRRTVAPDPVTERHLPRSGEVKTASNRFLAQTRSHASAGAKAARILLVDDDLTLRNCTAMVLRHHGYEVITADGAGAAAMVAANRIDLVITDILMPDCSGWDLIADLRTRHPHLPVIAISGLLTSDSSAAIVHARELGVAAAIAKPVPMPDLIAAIEGLLRARDTPHQHR